MPSASALVNDVNHGLSTQQRQSLEKAKEQLTKVLQRDAKVVDRDLADVFQKQARTNEGCMYDDTNKDAPAMHKRPALVEVPGGFVPMPTSLKQAASDRLEYHCFMGVFTGIRRAWMTIDHILFLWDYADPRGSFYQYDGLDQAIIHAALVRPRPGVFAADATPTWLLLLSTPLEVVVLALYCTGGVGHESSEIEIHETGFSVPSDGVNMVRIEATPAGRIFMSGADGFLYELQYGTVNGWWDVYRTCAKRNCSRRRDRAIHFVKSAIVECADPIMDLLIDEERNLLYTLSQSSCVQLYDLGDDGEATTFIHSIDVRTLYNKLKAVGSRSDATRKLEEEILASEKAAKDARSGRGPPEFQSVLIGLAAVPLAASLKAQLVLTSAAGIRIYLKTTEKSLTASGRCLPYEISPLFTLSPPRTSDGRIWLRCQRGGVLNAGDCALLASALDGGVGAQGGSTEIVCITDLAMPAQEDAARAASDSERGMVARIRVQGDVYAVLEERQPNVPYAYELGTQHNRPARSFVVLTSEGVQRLRKRRPIDELLEACRTHVPPQFSHALSPVHDLFTRYGADESCCMCLLAALSPSADAALLGALAVWVKELGGQPTILEQGVQTAGAAQGQAIKGPTTHFSGRHGGIYRAVCRLLEPVWAEKLMVEVPDDGVHLRRPKAFWQSLRADLQKVLSYLQQHALHWGLALPDGHGAVASAAEITAARQQQQQSLRQLAGAMMFDPATSERWRKMELAHAAQRESESLECIVLLLKRATQAATLMAALASEERPPSLDPTLHMLPTEPFVFMQRIAANLPANMRAALKTITLQDILVPLQKDAQGRPQPGKWDVLVAERLPKALFMEIGEIRRVGDGGGVTSQLQRECPDFFSSADESSLQGWKVLQSSQQPNMDEPTRAQLLQQALRIFVPIVGTVKLDHLLGSFMSMRAKLIAAPAAHAASIETTERAVVELAIAAAKACDPANAAARLLLGDGTGGSTAEWPAKLRTALVGRLRCYRLFIETVESMNGGGAATGANDTLMEPWVQMLDRALRVEPADALFHHAIFWWLIDSRREQVLLQLRSRLLEPFVSTTKITEQVRFVWGRFLSATDAASLLSWDSFAALPVALGMAVAEQTVLSGELKPRVLFNLQRYVEAARAYSTLAEATTPLSSQEPVRSRHLAIEGKINHLTMALRCAQDYSHIVVEDLGIDFVRSLEERQQRAQVQLRVAKDLASLLDSPGNRDAATLAALNERHVQVCSSLIEINALFTWSWDAQLWRSSLAILDFAKPYKEYPQCVTIALKNILGPPVGLEWQSLVSEVAALRKAHPNNYVFQLDTICALLESQQLSRTRPGDGTVPLLLGPTSTVVRPPVPWADLYLCYGNPSRFGPEMRRLWDSDERTRLHLLRSLRTLLDRWFSGARVDDGGVSRANLSAMQRQLGIAADLDRIIGELGGYISHDAYSENAANELRGAFRELMREVTALSYL